MTTEAIPFVAFPKIPRLNRTIVVSEKLDGTNSSVYVPGDETAPLLFGSRNRWITPKDDNAGFARWGTEHSDELRKGLGIGLHHGEWWGAGIQRKYGLNHKRFSLFNTGCLEQREQASPVLGVFDRFDMDGIRACLDGLRERGSVAVPGFHPAEGIVLFHQASGALFKWTIEKDEEPKGKSNASSNDA